MKYISVSTTLPDKNSAKKMAKTLVEERLAACTNIFRIDSLYWWQEKMEEKKEYELVFKTRRVLYPELEKRISEYFNKTALVLPFYKEQGRLTTINGIGDIDAIFADIELAVGAIQS